MAERRLCTYKEKPEEKGEGTMYEFRPAVREEVGLLIGIYGPSGGGKTYSAMRIASGIVGKGERFAVIDTEARRSLHYAEMFLFDFVELKPPFTPQNYIEAIKQADKAGYKVIVVDSGSHEWAGEGGVLDMQEDELQRMAGNDDAKRERCKMASWIKPKKAHKQWVAGMLQIHAHLIICLRAEEKVKMEKIGGKTQIVPVGFQPICSKELPYELTISFMLTPDKPGIPQPLKLQEQHKSIFPLDKHLDEESGKRISEWARGGAKRETPKSPDENTIRDQKLQQIMGLCKNMKVTKKDEILKKVSGVLNREIKSSLKTELTDEEVDILLSHLKSF